MSTIQIPYLTLAFRWSLYSSPRARRQKQLQAISMWNLKWLAWYKSGTGETHTDKIRIGFNSHLQQESNVQSLLHYDAHITLSLFAYNMQYIQQCDSVAAATIWFDLRSAVCAQTVRQALNRSYESNYHRKQALFIFIALTWQVAFNSILECAGRVLKAPCIICCIKINSNYRWVNKTFFMASDWIQTVTLRSSALSWHCGNCGFFPRFRKALWSYNAY